MIEFKILSYTTFKIFETSKFFVTTAEKIHLVVTVTPDMILGNYEGQTYIRTFAIHREARHSVKIQRIPIQITVKLYISQRDGLKACQEIGFQPAHQCGVGATTILPYRNHRRGGVDCTVNPRRRSTSCKSVTVSIRIQRQNVQFGIHVDSYPQKCIRIFFLEHFEGHYPFGAILTPHTGCFLNNDLTFGLESQQGRGAVLSIILGSVYSIAYAIGNTATVFGRDFTG